MKTLKARTAILSILALSISAIAYADSVVINGTRYTCENECVVEVRPGGYSVTDCCGGLVTIILR